MKMAEDNMYIKINLDVSPTKYTKKKLLVFILLLKIYSGESEHGFEHEDKHTIRFGFDCYHLVWSSNCTTYHKYK